MAGRFFFAADDNLFSEKQQTPGIAEALARKVDGGSRRSN